MESGTNMMTMKLFLIAFVFTCLVSGIVSSRSVLSLLENDAVSAKPFSSPQPIMVNLTLIQGADSKGAGLSLSYSPTQIT